ncbi:hypothetical protein [Vulgatibacter sp.]
MITKVAVLATDAARVMPTVIGPRSPLARAKVCVLRIPRQTSHAVEAA